MTVVKDKKREKAEALIRKFDPSYRQRWEIYDGILKRLTGPEARWLDAGCGNNIALEEFPCAVNVGIDIYRHPDVLKSPPNFLCSAALKTFRSETGLSHSLHSIWLSSIYVNPMLYSARYTVSSHPVGMFSFIPQISSRR